MRPPRDPSLEPTRGPAYHLRVIEPRCTSESAHLAEVFSAIQGEGTVVGERQVFVRFLECHIRCPYCDTPDQDPKKVTPRLERTAGRRDWEFAANPIPAATILDAILRLQSHGRLHRWVSFTGGEPLWYWPMIEHLAPALRARDLQVYLETDGLLPDELAKVARMVDLCAMDAKLHWKRHDLLDRDATLAFVATLRALATPYFVKVVVPAGVSRVPFLGAIGELARATGGEVPLVLQPVTPYGVVKETPAPAEMLELHELASAVYPACRVVPQVHKLIGQL